MICRCMLVGRCKVGGRSTLAMLTMPTPPLLRFGLSPQICGCLLPVYIAGNSVVCRRRGAWICGGPPTAGGQVRPGKDAGVGHGDAAAAAGRPGRGGRKPLCRRRTAVDDRPADPHRRGQPWRTALPPAGAPCYNGVTVLDSLGLMIHLQPGSAEVRLDGAARMHATVATALHQIAKLANGHAVMQHDAWAACMPLTAPRLVLACVSSVSHDLALAVCCFRRELMRSHCDVRVCCCRRSCLAGC